MIEATDRQMQLANAWTTERLEADRIATNARLDAMTREEYDGEAGLVAMQWRRAIDRVLIRREAA